MCLVFSCCRTFYTVMCISWSRCELCSCMFRWEDSLCLHHCTIDTRQVFHLCDQYGSSSLPIPQCIIPRALYTLISMAKLNDVCGYGCANWHDTVMWLWRWEYSHSPGIVECGGIYGKSHIGDQGVIECYTCMYNACSYCAEVKAKILIYSLP